MINTAKMDTDSTTHILPASSDEELVFDTLVFSGQQIALEDAPTIPLYSLSRELACMVQRNMSIIFERVEFVESNTSSKRRRQTHDLYYLVHPRKAHYRDDLPEYYITAAAPGTLGNVQFDISKSDLEEPSLKQYSMMISQLRMFCSLIAILSGRCSTSNQRGTAATISGPMPMGKILLMSREMVMSIS